MNAVSINDIYQMLSNLDNDNKRWLADKLIRDINDSPSKAAKRQIEFPKIAKDFKISSEVEALTIGKLPEGFDFEKETDKMWEECAQ